MIVNVKVICVILKKVVFMKKILWKKIGIGTLKKKKRIVLETQKENIFFKIVLEECFFVQMQFQKNRRVHLP